MNDAEELIFCYVERMFWFAKDKLYLVLESYILRSTNKSVSVCKIQFKRV